ncbi:MAG: class I SAM-dependent methyltransferase [Candidatus Zipacnadales bacterium]
MDSPCRLCGGYEAQLLYRGNKRSSFREFLHCPVCDLVYVPDRFLVSRTEEKTRYEQHCNDPTDQGYRRFLGQLMKEILPLVKPGAEGLDFGCGPQPVLAWMLEQAGFSMRRYDPYFEPDDSALKRTYDFITCSETIEHFREPRAEFDRLDRLLRPGGVVGIMTAMLDDWTDFPDWHYHSDRTHVCYYSPRTMRWIGERYRWEISLPRPNVAVACKKRG